MGECILSIDMAADFVTGAIAKICDSSGQCVRLFFQFMVALEVSLRFSDSSRVT
jgi:hypothetical protein